MEIKYSLPNHNAMWVVVLWLLLSHQNTQQMRVNRQHNNFLKVQGHKPPQYTYNSLCKMPHVPTMPVQSHIFRWVRVLRLKLQLYNSFIMFLFISVFPHITLYFLYNITRMLPPLNIFRVHFYGLPSNAQKFAVCQAATFGHRTVVSLSDSTTLSV